MYMNMQVILKLLQKFIRHPVSIAAIRRHLVISCDLVDLVHCTSNKLMFIMHTGYFRSHGL